MRAFIVFIGVLLVALLAIVGQSNGLDERDGQATAPKKYNFFDFKQFKQRYNRHYSSLIEEMNREKIFLKNFFHTSVSKLKYKTKSSDKYLEVNDFSDRSEKELDDTLIKPEIIYSDMEDMVPDDENFQKVDSNTKKSFITKFKKRMKQMDEKLDVFTNNLDNFFTHLAVAMPKRRKDLPDEIFIDHRESDCFNTVRDQGRCGSCAIFSSTALYEWAYCKINGRQIRFSEQYPIDCGRKLSGISGCDGNSPKKLGDFVRDFGFELLSDYAYEAKDNECPFEVKGKKPKDEMGAIRMAGKNRPALKYVPFKKIEEYLKITPVLMSIRMSSDAFQYGGGVDDGVGCEKKPGFHSMLIVGSGRQDGHEYWIFRNSYSWMWGEGGYYRLKKNNNCYIIWANGLVFDTIDPKQASFEELKNRVEPLPLLRVSQAPKFVEFVENPSHDKKLDKSKDSRSTIRQLFR